MNEQAERDREEQLRAIPLKAIDRSKWPKGVREIAMGEMSGLGIDNEGRLHWGGKPVEIIGRRIDLTTTQTVIAIVVAAFTALGAVGAALQGWAAYHDWACKVRWPALVACPAPTPGLPLEPTLHQPAQRL